MSKLKKAIIIIGIVLVLALGGTFAFCYLNYKDDTVLFIKQVVAFINQPLPIISVSLITLLGFIYKAFISSNFGKKTLNNVKSEFDAFKSDTSTKIDEYKKLYESNQLMNDYIVSCLIKVCETSPNAKLNSLATDIKTSYESKKAEISNGLKDLGTIFNEVYMTMQNADYEKFKEQVLNEIENYKNGVSEQNGKE